MADAPIATILYRERFILHKPSVQGMKYTGMDGQIMGDQSLAEVYLVQ
jgi:hypothetical protein